MAGGHKLVRCGGVSQRERPCDHDIQSPRVHGNAVTVVFSSGQVGIELVSPGAARAREALRAYLNEVASRYYGREATEDELEAAIRDNPSDDLVLPHGLFLLAHKANTVLGCAGLRFREGQIGEVTRVYVMPHVRGHGLGSRLMTELEKHAREHALSTLRLDTRSDLVEARRLYERLGYQEVPAFSAGPHAGHWLAKELD